MTSNVRAFFCFIHFGFYIYLPVGCCAERRGWSELIRLYSVGMRNTEYVV